MPSSISENDDEGRGQRKRRTSSYTPFDDDDDNEKTSLIRNNNNHEERRSKTPHNNNSWPWTRSLKVSLLTLLCVSITSVMTLFPEQLVRSTMAEVSVEHPFTMIIAEDGGRSSRGLLRVALTGKLEDEEGGESNETLVVVATKGEEQRTWRVGVGPRTKRQDNNDQVDIVVGHTFKFFHSQDKNNKNNNVTLEIFGLLARGSAPVPMYVETQLMSGVIGEKSAHTLGLALGAIVLLVMYGLILFEVIHRALATMLAATSCVAILALVDARPSLSEIVNWIDVETLALLFSMMVIVSILSETGVFNYISFVAYRITRGRTWPLLGALCFMTAAVSALLDNVTTILLMTPVIIQLCEEMRVDPRRVLIANVIFSNIGGAATAIGDPPNVLIVSDPQIQAGGVDFATFTVHMTLCSLMVAVVGFLQLRFMYGSMEQDMVDQGQDDDDNDDNSDNDDVTRSKKLRQEIGVWTKTAQSMSCVSREEIVVREAVNSKIEELNEEVEIINSSVFGGSERRRRRQQRQQSDEERMKAFENSCQIKDRILLLKSSAVLLVTVVLFFLSNFPQFNLGLGWTALLGAMTLLVLSDKSELDSVFAKVEWSTLMFFATLFVVMEAVSKLGLLRCIGGAVQYIVESVPEDARLGVAIVIVVWVSGITSAFIDNIPFTAMMIPVIKELSLSDPVTLPLQPLVWSLALGASLGGNGTLIGASANVVCAGIAEQHGHKFTFLDFFRVGFPITLVSMCVATVYLIVCHVCIGWTGV